MKPIAVGKVNSRSLLQSLTSLCLFCLIVCSAWRSWLSRPANCASSISGSFALVRCNSLVRVVLIAAELIYCLTSLATKSAKSTAVLALRALSALLVSFAFLPTCCDAGWSLVLCRCGYCCCDGESLQRASAATKSCGWPSHNRRNTRCPLARGSPSGSQGGAFAFAAAHLRRSIRLHCIQQTPTLAPQRRELSSVPALVSQKNSDDSKQTAR